MNAQTQLPATIDSLADVEAEYLSKIEDIDNLIAEYEQFHDQIETRSSVRGSYVGRVFNYHPSLHRRTIEDNLRKSAWNYAYRRLHIDKIASAKDRKSFQMALENPPEFSLDNVRAAFGDYARDPRFHILKGLAECFSDLDPAFKSHSKIKIGVKGLPKRIIISNVTGYGSWGRDRLKDTINALRVFRGLEHLDHGKFEDFMSWSKAQDNAPEWVSGSRYPSSSIVKYDGDIYKNRGNTQNGDTFEIGEKKWQKLENPEPGLSLKTYQNGNGHLSFSPDILRDVNMALAEFYGEVLPDIDETPEKKRASTAVSKDLQFYPTPRAVIDRILNGICERKDMKILEPSCGDGVVMDAVREWCPTAEMLGIEVHLGRAELSRSKGHHVMVANFLETTPKAYFDLVIMNPPFYGVHWKKHVEHARKFLKQRTKENWRGGMLVCILPATAFYDGHLKEMGVPDSAWTDLPVASFAQSGTNIPTGYIQIGA